MQISLARTIQKHYPIYCSSIIGSQCESFVIKCQLQNWMQLQQLDHSTDIISLPSLMKMAEIYCCLDSSISSSQHTQYYLKNQDKICIVSQNQNDDNFSSSQIQINNSIIVTNALYLRDGNICNISINKQGQSQLNVFNHIEQKINHYSRQMNFQMAPYSNLTKCNNNIFYVSNAHNQQYLVSYNIQMEISSLISVPQVEINKYTKCFSLSSNSNYSYQDQIVCIYGKSWLALADTRLKNLVSMHPLSYCQSAFSKYNAHNGMPRVLYAQNSNIYEFDIRKGQSMRNPLVVHPNNISNCSMLAQNILGVEDDSSCSLHLYKFN